jgi:hypothetical protein
MVPDSAFSVKPKRFWAYVRSVSERFGYTERGTKRVKCPAVPEIAQCLLELGLNPDVVVSRGNTTSLGSDLADYFSYRADRLNSTVEPLLMDGPEAHALFDTIRQRLTPSPRCLIPMNKQKGAKKHVAWFTAMINMLIDDAIGGSPCDYDPRQLTAFTRDNAMLRTFARRVDGAFPSATNPIALWEIKEYYDTTTFGSRVADGVYETLLDGMEIEEMAQAEEVKAHHYLMVDSHYTWWECGRSYLCRIFDMLHMGYVEEVLIGREIVDRLPVLAQQWVEELSIREQTESTEFRLR